ncbi:IclR family transcriptional regulator [Gephyromycinifex aptenodytis]|uniref:IclR family transcriptional regulator n=1 Tax=Gephyromycinifex aptenodytis TaxID=2716227 RepID=UPI00144501ED|nr:IclR family transcriptional regulator [Gephyromycinifex aptenodytis]
MADDVVGVREVKSAVRTVEVLEYLAGRQANPARLKEVADGVDAPRSSTYALLKTLIGCGWVQVDESGNFYSLGIRVLIAGTSFIDSDPHVRVVRPIIADLAARLNETIHLGRLDGDQIVYLATQESHQEIRGFNRVGRRLPAWATSLGKALLAERTAKALELPRRLQALTPHTITDRQDLLEDLERTRQRGYSIDREENTLGLQCYGMALHYGSPAMDAISCSVPLTRLTPEHESKILDALSGARLRIEQSAPLFTR